MTKIGFNPSAQYWAVSEDEVMIRGGHLDGFDFSLRDPTGRGELATLFARLEEGVDLDDLSGDAAGLLTQSGTNGDEQSEELSGVDQLTRAGILREFEDADPMHQWMAFQRFGQPLPDGAASLTIHGHDDIVAALGTGALDGGVSSSGASIDDLFDRLTDDAASPGAVPAGTQDGAAVDVQGNGHADAGAPDSDESDADPDLQRSAPVVVATSGSVVGRLQELNKVAVEADQDILYIQASGAQVAVGPLVVPGITPCFWEYERQRARSMFDAYSYLSARRAEDQLGGRTAAPTLRFAASVAVPRLVELALFGQVADPATVAFASATVPSIDTERIMRLPRCATCFAKRPLRKALLP